MPFYHFEFLLFWLASIVFCCNLPGKQTREFTLVSVSTICPLSDLYNNVSARRPTVCVQGEKFIHSFTSTWLIFREHQTSCVSVLVLSIGNTNGEQRQMCSYPQGADSLSPVERHYLNNRKNNHRLRKRIQSPGKLMPGRAGLVGVYQECSGERKAMLSL